PRVQLGGVRRLPVVVRLHRTMIAGGPGTGCHDSVTIPEGRARWPDIYFRRMAKGLYVGRGVDPDSGKPGSPLELDPDDLLTHGLIVGMTGSGKTGLAIVMLEELLRQGVPVIAIDPKGDLANLLLLFDKLAPSQFEPWIDAGAARREGKDVKTVAA